VSDERERPPEREAVRTTIVGGRPPGSGQSVGPIPRGVEVLVKKAAVDPAFRARLLELRDGAAAEIGLSLEPAEALMLRSVPAEQLEAIVRSTQVSPRLRPVFLGTAASLMLAALGTTGCPPAPTRGIQPDPPPPGAASEPASGAQGGTLDALPAQDAADPASGAQGGADGGTLDALPAQDAADPDAAPPAAPGDQVAPPLKPPPGDRLTRGIRPDRPGRR